MVGIIEQLRDFFDGPETAPRTNGQAEGTIQLNSPTRVQQDLEKIASGELKISAATYSSLDPDTKKRLEELFNRWRKENNLALFDTGNREAFLETIHLIQTNRSLTTDAALLRKSAGLVVDNCMGPRTFRALALELDPKGEQLPVLAFDQFKQVTGGLWDVSQNETDRQPDFMQRAGDRGSTQIIPRLAVSPTRQEQSRYTESEELLMDNIGRANPFFRKPRKCGSYAQFVVDRVFGEGTSARTNEDRSLEGERMSALAQRINNHEFSLGTIFWVYKRSPEELGLYRDSNRYVARGKPHYFVLVGYDQNGTPLFSDQHARKENGYVYHGLNEVPRARNADFKLGGVREPSSERQLALAQRLDTERAA